MSVTFIQKGTGFIKQAIEKDYAGQYELALDLYANGIQYLLTGIKHEKNKKIAQVITSKAMKYLTRAEDIKHALINPKFKVKCPDIPGLDTAKQALKGTIILPINPSKGTLIYGPSRCKVIHHQATDKVLIFPSGTSKLYIERIYAIESERLNKHLFDLTRNNKSTKRISSTSRAIIIDKPTITWNDVRYLEYHRPKSRHYKRFKHHPRTKKYQHKKCKYNLKSKRRYNHRW